MEQNGGRLFFGAKQTAKWQVHWLVLPQVWGRWTVGRCFESRHVEQHPGPA